jgi:hypothetical protein
MAYAAVITPALSKFWSCVALLRLAELHMTNKKKKSTLIVDHCSAKL